MASINFLNELNNVEGGTVVQAVKADVDPLTIARIRFIKACKSAIDGLAVGQGMVTKEGTTKANFYEILKDGRVKVTLKNVNYTLELKPGKTYWMRPNVEEAMKFLAKAVLAAEAGELDEVFKAGKPKTYAEKELDKLQREMGVIGA